MRFYAKSRKYRIWASLFWSLIVLVWSSTATAHHSRHQWQSILWLAIAFINISVLWTYWAITDDELSAHVLCLTRRYKLSSISSVRPAGAATPARAIQVDLRDRNTLTIAVADQQQFEHALRGAVANTPDRPASTGPRGLFT